MSTRADERVVLQPNASMDTLQFLLRDELACEHIALTWHNATPREWPLAEQVATERILYNLIANAPCTTCLRAALKRRCGFSLPLLPHEP